MKLLICLTVLLVTVLGAPAAEISNGPATVPTHTNHTSPFKLVNCCKLVQQGTNIFTICGDLCSEPPQPLHQCCREVETLGTKVKACGQICTFVNPIQPNYCCYGDVCGDHC